MQSAVEPLEEVPALGGAVSGPYANDILDKPIADLFLTVRAGNVLKNAEVRFVGDLVQLSEQWLLSFQNCGRKTVNELTAKLREHGLKLGTDLSDWTRPPIENRPPSPPGVAKSLNALDESTRAKLFLRVREIGLPRRAQTALASADIEFVGDLIQKNDLELRKISSCGRETILEIESKLAELGLRLDTALTDWSKDAAKSIRKAQDRRDDSPVTSLRRQLSALPPATSLEGELRDVLSSIATAREIEITERQLGWSGIGHRTLDSVAQDYGVTRERIRQIVARVTEKISARKYDTPWLSKALAVLRSNCPATPSTLASALRIDGLSQVEFEPSGIATACEFLGKDFGIELVTIAGRKLYTRTNNSKKIVEFFRSVRRQTSRGGCANFHALCDELKIAENERDNFEQIATIDGFCDWLDVGRSWLYAPSVTRNRLFNLVAKVLSVSERVHLSELRRAVSRSRRLEVVPPAAVIAELVTRLGLATVTENTVIAAPDLPVAIEPGSTEYILAAVMRAHGPVLAWDRFQELCVASGMNPITFGIYLSGSPIIARVARGIYSLVGANIPPGRVEELEEEIAASRKPADWGWSTRGTLWYAVRVSGSVLGSGTVSAPSFVAEFVGGEWQPRIGDRTLDGPIKCNGRFVWGLRRPLLNAGAESGDTCILEFDIAKRSVGLTIGGEELVDMWESGDIDIPPPEISDGDETDQSV